MGPIQLSPPGSSRNFRTINEERAKGGQRPNTVAGILRETRALEDPAVVDLLRKRQLKGQDFQISPDWIGVFLVRGARNHRDEPDREAPLRRGRFCIQGLSDLNACNVWASPCRTRHSLAGNKFKSSGSLSLIFVNSASARQVFGPE